MAANTAPDVARTHDIQRAITVAELTVEDHERQATVVIGVVMRDDYCIDAPGLDPLLLHGRQRRDPAIEQKTARLRLDEHAALETASIAEGIAASDELHSHRLGRQGDRRERGRSIQRTMEATSTLVRNQRDSAA